MCAEALGLTKEKQSISDQKLTGDQGSRIWTGDIILFLLYTMPPMETGRVSSRVKIARYDKESVYAANRSSGNWMGF